MEVLLRICRYKMKLVLREKHGRSKYGFNTVSMTSMCYTECGFST